MPMLALFAAASGQQLSKYIEDLFSVYLYTGTGATQTITNNIDTPASGGLVWIKSRSAATNNNLFDTVRGATKSIHSNTTDSTVTDANSLTAFNSTGFTLGSGNTAGNEINTSAATYVSWTFKEQEKFFDIVTYTGTGANRTIAHNLGSVPGCIMVKRTDSTADWQVYHSSLANTQYMVLNSTAAVATGATRWNSTTPTSAVFSVGTDITVNDSSGTYVAYLFASNAGGFGLTGTDNVISCGSFTTDAGGDATVSLGYEPQFGLGKVSSTTSTWVITDTMRGMTTAGGTNAQLFPNTSAAEASGTGYFHPTATGFTFSGGGASATWIYIAVRRGPMEVPTVGTSVFGLNARTGTDAVATVTGSAGVSDAVLVKNRGSAVASLFSSRLTGTGYLVTSTTASEVAAGTTILQANPWDVMDGVKVGTTSTITNASANTFVNYLFDRAPSFFDEVCYTGTSANTTQAHNLGAVPELIIVKARSNTTNWYVYVAALGNNAALELQDTSASGPGQWNTTSPTTTVFSLGTGSSVNGSGYTYVAYLFATCAGVSKVGSYTGTATTKQIDCGFTAGARFVLIKRTDDVGSWYFWDSARGIVAGNDPYLLLNSTAAEVTSTDYVDTYAAGFELTSTAPADINASGGTFIFLAIA